MRATLFGSARTCHGVFYLLCLQHLPVAL